MTSINMKNFFLGAAFVALAGSASAANVGVSVTVGEPGFYGRIDIGGAPPPRLIYAQPVIIQTAPSGYMREPIYLRVPPGHEKHWDKNCRKYNACNQKVYFVQDSWYRDEYAPSRHHDSGYEGEGKGKGKGHHKQKKHDRD